jgi:hypothetical protein
VPAERNPDPSIKSKSN